jgi:hypothetical protein
MPLRDTFWARGNAWVFVMLVELLTTLPEESPLRQEFLPHFTKMAETLASLQADSGLWHTVLYDPAAYQETSASALFAYGLHKGMRLGLLEPDYMDVVRRAMSGVESRLYKGCRGGVIVSGTSHGTDPGEWEQYANITVGDQVPYGVGAVLLAAVEVGDWAVQGAFEARAPCPDVSDDPQTPEEFLARALYRLKISNLEGARADFRVLADLEPNKGEGPLGLALIQAFFTGFRAFDALTRYTIGEVTWGEFREFIREETLPDLEEIRRELNVVKRDRGFYLHIPEMTLNRRGLYTPLRDLHIDSRGVRGALNLLGIVELILRGIS